MKSSIRLRIEELESRAMPSGTLLSGHILPVSGGAFLPPGIVRAVNNPDEIPSPVKVSRDGTLAFLPPGIVRAMGDPDQFPPPVQVSRDGTLAFLPPGIAHAIGDPDEAPSPITVSLG
jgi:hypothetical protein